MYILSFDRSMVAFFPATNVRHVWHKGGHTVNVFSGLDEIDCYTFAWAKNRPSMLDFTTALQSYLSEE